VASFKQPNCYDHPKSYQRITKLSSILKALKKIEEEAPPPKTFPSLPQSIDSKQAFSSNTLKRRRARKILIFLILLAAAGTAAGFLFSQRRLIIAKIRPGAGSSNKRGAVQTPPPDKIFKAKISNQTTKSALVRPVQKGPKPNHTKSSVTRSVANESQAEQATFASQSAAGNKDSKLSSLRSTAKVAPKANIEKPLKKSSIPKRAVSAEKSVVPSENAPIEPVAAAAKRSSPAPAKAAYDRVEDSKLKLQALAWSADDTRRMAVINGRIVREGESVDGYQVIQIREEDVVVNDGGKSWRLEFGAQR
jgi:MSHA biogenesis protein MshK